MSTDAWVAGFFFHSSPCTAKSHLEMTSRIYLVVMGPRVHHLCRVSALVLQLRFVARYYTYGTV